MKKVKVFKFEVSNHTYQADKENNRSLLFWKAEDRLFTEKEIECVLNDFLEDKELVSMNVNNFTTNQHNNGCSDTVYLVYTLVYLDQEK